MIRINEVLQNTEAFSEQFETLSRAALRLTSQFSQLPSDRDALEYHIYTP